MTLSNVIKTIRRMDSLVKVEVPATHNHKAYSYMREGSDNPSTPKSGVNKKAIAAGISVAIAAGALTAGVLSLRRAKKEETIPSNPSIPEWEKGIKDRPKSLYSVFHKSNAEKGAPLDIDIKDIVIESAGHGVSHDYKIMEGTKPEDISSDISTENIRGFQKDLARWKGLQSVAKSKIKDSLPENHGQKTSVFTVKNKNKEDVYFMKTEVPTQRKDFAGRTISNYYTWRLPKNVKPEDIPVDWGERLSDSMEKHIKETGGGSPDDLDTLVKSFVSKDKGRFRL